MPSEETTKTNDYQSPDTLKQAAVRLKGDGLQTIQERAEGARIDLHACNVGQSEQSMEGWAQFFGGKNVIVGAPKVFIEFWAPRGDGPIRINLDKDMKHGNGVPLEDGMKKGKLFNEKTFDSGPLGTKADELELIRKSQTKAPDVNLGPTPKPDEYHLSPSP